VTTFAAIPTMYAGIRFRSRLEAKWAAFFDAMQWRWQYEPFDLHGYIPDFLLDIERPVVVEVKPYMTTEDLFSDRGDAKAKVDASDWDGEALIVGCQLWDEPAGNAYHTLGLMRAKDGVWDRAFPYHCILCGCPSFAHASDGWWCRINGCALETGGGSEHIDYLTEPFPQAFREAGNTTQWRRPQ
jgi:hypothetical protein